jgi:hypothetical protein
MTTDQTGLIGIDVHLEHDPGADHDTLAPFAAMLS